MNPSFEHEALSLDGQKQMVYTAFSKHYFYFRAHISKFVLKQGKVPLNPFMLFDYFLLDSIDRNLVRDANNSVVLKSDELWVFGPISNGVLAEILIAKKQNKPVKYFKIENSKDIFPIPHHAVEMEKEVQEFKALLT